MLILVMGVSGCGKTTLGKYFAKKFSWRFIDADDFHSKANITKMSAGIPLNDRDRMPWLQALHRVIKIWEDKGDCGVLACSALKQSYRDILINGTSGNNSETSNDVYNKTLIVHLKGDKDAISKRITCRNGHFMSDKLLDSQYETLEEPDINNQNTLCLSAEDSVEDNAESIAQALLEVFGVQTSP